MSGYVDYFNELIKSGFFFWLCAIFGSVLFCIQFLVNLFSVDAHSVSESVDSLSADTDLADSLAFKWFSLQTSTGFIMIFGWAGLACQKEFVLEMIPTIGIATMAGFCAVLMIYSVFRGARRLHSTGSRYNLAEAVGKEAYVYQRIPKGGIGKISMTLQECTHEIDAKALHSEEIPSFTRVQVLEKIDDNTVVVTPL